MKRLILSLLILLPLAASAQKIEHDDETNQITVDGVHAFDVKKENCGWSGMDDCHFDVYDLSGKKVIRANYRSFNSAAEISRSNTHGTERYYEFIFLDSKQKAEVDYLSLKEKHLAKTIVKAGLIVDGKLNEKAVEEFVLVHGTRFSEKERRSMR